MADQISEWLTVKEIAHLWSEETGENAQALEQSIGGWYTDFLVQNAYTNPDNADEPIESRQVWRDTFSSYCEERALTKPRFWFAGEPGSVPQTQPQTQPGQEAAVDPEAQLRPAEKKQPKRRSRRRGLLVGLVLIIVAIGLAVLFLKPAEDRGEESKAQSPTAGEPTPAEPASEEQAAATAVEQSATEGEGLAFLIQQELKTAGFYVGSLDGWASPALEDAIVAYQRAQALPADGKATTALLYRLARHNLDQNRQAETSAKAEAVASSNESAPSASALVSTSALTPAPDTSPLDSGDTAEIPIDLPKLTQWNRKEPPQGQRLVFLIQERLMAETYEPGPADGKVGPRTRKAILGYQRANDLENTGVASLALLEHLGGRSTERRALQLYRRGAYKAAIAAFTELVRKRPENPNTYFNRGLAYRMAGSVERALADYETAIRLDETYFRAYFDRGNIYYDDGRYAGALRDYFRGIGAWFEAD